MKDGSQAGELAIENERLKTSILVLQQKLKLQDDSDSTNRKLKDQMRDYEDEID